MGLWLTIGLGSVFTIVVIDGVNDCVLVLMNTVTFGSGVCIREKIYYCEKRNLFQRR